MAGDRSAASHALVQSTLLGELLENAKIGALAIESGRYVAANGYACELIGCDRAELIGRHVGDLNPSAMPEHFVALINDRRDRDVLTIRRRDGQEIEVAYHAVETMLSGLPLRLALLSRV